MSPASRYRDSGGIRDAGDISRLTRIENVGKLCTLFVVKGRVQGVWYRASAQREAERLGLRGWIRNMDSGDVETLACGDREQLRSFERWLQRGPEKAIVTSVSSEPRPCEAPQSFDVR